MPEPAFRGDPYRILGVERDATGEEIKRRWRDLAREHHPDRAAGDLPEQERLTTRMARINAAYDVLRDPVRRARHDASPHARRTWEAERDARPWTGAPSSRDAHGRAGPPPPPPTRPVTGRFDTSASFRARNATMGGGASPLRGQGPRGRITDQPNDLRASTPTGPVHRRRSAAQPRVPTLGEARATMLEFGRFHGWTLGDVADHEPTYIDWIARTITRDRDLVVRARIIAADLDERGVERQVRPARPGFGNPRGEREAAEASA